MFEFIAILTQLLLATGVDEDLIIVWIWRAREFLNSFLSFLQL